MVARGEAKRSERNPGIMSSFSEASEAGDSDTDPLAVASGSQFSLRAHAVTKSC